MPGFPLRSIMQSFGSRLRDARPVEHPELERGAARANLTEHIAAGSSLILPRASLIAQWSVSLGAFEIYHQEEAWNSRHEQAHPTLARLFAGAYTYTFASTYLDLDGVAQPFEILAVRCSVIASNNPAAGCSHSANEVLLEVQHSDALADMRFWLEVF